MHDFLVFCVQLRRRFMAESKNIWLLDNIEIASPCPKKWEEMQGDDTRRFCDGCGHHVYNFASMTRDEAETLLRESEGRLCARLYQREDGAIKTSDCPQTDDVKPLTFSQKMRAWRRKLQQKPRGAFGLPFSPAPPLMGIVARPALPDSSAISEESSTRSEP